MIANSGAQAIISSFSTVWAAGNCADTKNVPQNGMNGGRIIVGGEVVR
jgi:hypothetical protein